MRDAWQSFTSQICKVDKQAINVSTNVFSHFNVILSEAKDLAAITVYGFERAKLRLTTSDILQCSVNNVSLNFNVIFRFAQDLAAITMYDVERAELRLTTSDVLQFNACKKTWLTEHYA